MKLIEKLKLYQGFHYPVIGERFVCGGNRHAMAYTNYLRIFGHYISYGIKVRLSNPETPYSLYAVNKICTHSEMKLGKFFYNDRGEVVDEKDKDVEGHIWTVNTKDGLSIGDIATAYGVCELEKFDTYLKDDSEDSTTVCCGYSREERKWFGWSHRAFLGFGLGDMVYEPEFGNELTPFLEHGEERIDTLEKAKIAAQRFAWDVS